MNLADLFCSHTLFKMGHQRPLFLFLSFQYTVDSKQMFNINKCVAMNGFKLQTSGFESNRSTN